MSASTERKNRQAARAAGTDKKMLAAQEAAKLKKKSQLRWTLGTIAVVLLIVNYYYANEYHHMVNQYGNYISMFGLDTRSGISGLDKQSCPMLEDGSWRDYFLQNAEESMKQVKALSDYAKANDISLTDEEIANVDAEIAQLSDYAKTGGYSSANNLLAANYGNGVTTALVRQASLDGALAAKAYSTVNDALSYSAEDLEAALAKFHSSVQKSDIIQIRKWEESQGV